MSTDAELLSQYVEHASQEAFAELVRRHVGFVYATAVRKGRSPSRAEDITQVVFTDLARKAPKLVGRTELVGWLYTSTQYAAAKLIRTEVRRENREKEAQAMHELTSDSAVHIDWEQIHPVLDEALQELSELDRSAILLRFFRNQSYSEVGETLNVSEEAARKRATRALDQLHAALSRRGITSTAAALTAALLAQPAMAAPAGLAASVSSTALGAAAGGFAGSATGILDALLNTKTVISGAAVLSAAFVWMESARTSDLTGQFAQQNAGLFAMVRALSSSPTTKVQPGATASGASVGAGRATDPAAKTAVIVDPMPGLSLPTQPIPPEALRNAGLATPLDALQTLAWSLYLRDVDALSGSVVFSAAGRPKAEALLAGMPDTLRARISDPEHMWAMHLLANPNPYRAAAIRVLARSQPGHSNLALRVGIDPVGGNDPDRTATALFRKDSEGNWRQLVVDYDLNLFSQQSVDFAAEIGRFLDGRTSGAVSSP